MSDSCAFCSKAFRDELALLQKVRHPNVVQFLGAVTQSSPMMIVTEYLPKVFIDAVLQNVFIVTCSFSASCIVFVPILVLISYAPHDLSG